MIRMIFLFYILSFVLIEALPPKPPVWSPVFPNVSFIFSDTYDKLGWRLMKPDFLQLQSGQQPIVTFYFRKLSGDSEEPDKFVYPFYSVNCTECQLNVAYSFDGGWTWEEDYPLSDLPTVMQYGWFARPGPRVVLQNGSTLHVFLMKTAYFGNGLYHFSSNGSLPTSRGNIASRIIVSHMQDLAPSHMATPPHTPIVVNEGKRLVVASHIVVRNGNSEFGFSNVTVMYSDDSGSTWQTAEQELVVPSPQGGTGACEPTVIELLNGTIWMLIRYDGPIFYQSFSHDHGTTWTTPVPSKFVTFGSPAAFIRLSVRKPGILLIWNNGIIVESDNWYGSARQVIHAAVSYDEGVTWSGFRELYRDAHMAEPYMYGDHGTAYPDGKETSDGTVIVSTGQGAFRQVVLLFDPQWLLETHQYTTLDKVTQLNNTWDFEGNYFTTLDTSGLDIIIDPTNTSCSRDLKVIRMQEMQNIMHPPCIVYNFPGGKKGSVDLFFYPTSQSMTVRLSLMNFFTVPSNVNAEDMATFTVIFTSNTTYNSGETIVLLTPKEYQYVGLDWDTGIGICNVSVANEVVATVYLGSESKMFMMQPSYLRFRLLSGMLYLRSIETQLY